MCRSFEQAAASQFSVPEGATTADRAVQVGSMLGRGWAGAGMASLIPSTSLAAAAVSVAAPIFAGFAACYGIGRIAERARAIGAYNAFLSAFAQSISDFSRGIDRRRRNAAWQDASIKGRNAAIKVLTEIGQDARRTMFRHYRAMSDQQVIDAVVERMGGYLLR